mmetsp:Transcript_65572/g.174671  ORF Transcript_65572/g.174671 Transcript_65572/m.174671 type:complete len:206 (+) Transcript_65572:317-934(+)
MKTRFEIFRPRRGCAAFTLGIPETFRWKGAVIATRFAERSSGRSTRSGPERSIGSMGKGIRPGSSADLRASTKRLLAPLAKATLPGIFAEAEDLACCESSPTWPCSSGGAFPPSRARLALPAGASARCWARLSLSDLTWRTTCSRKVSTGTAHASGSSIARSTHGAAGSKECPWGARSSAAARADDREQATKKKKHMDGVHGMVR